MFKLSVRKFIKICKDVIGGDKVTFESKPPENLDLNWVVTCHGYGRDICSLVVFPDGSTEATIMERNRYPSPVYTTSVSLFFMRKLRKVVFVDTMFANKAEFVGTLMSEHLRDLTVYSADAFWVIMAIWSEFSRIPKDNTADIIEDLKKYSEKISKTVDKST